MSRFTFIDLFAGLGGIRIPFDALGGACAFTSEIDRKCQDIYELNFGHRPLGDITQIKPQDVPDHDILLAGFPCQAFSIIGKRQGFADTRGTLFFNIQEILRVKKPAAFLLENVRQLTTHDGGRTFEVICSNLKALGYEIHTTVLNALDFGVPQKRERTYIVGFREPAAFQFPKGGAAYNLADILEDEKMLHKKYTASAHIRKARQNALKDPPAGVTMWHENKSGHVSALPYSCALRASASYNYLLINGRRRPTEREMLRLQGFPDSYKIRGSYAQVKKQAGNSVSVPVIAAIAGQMLQAMEGVSWLKKSAA